MAYELIYTSAPNGLRPGTRGFTTVAMTKGMPAPLVARLENMSGYERIYPLGDPRHDQNPRLCRFSRLSLADRAFAVLSVIRPLAADYSGRSNHLAHHVVLEANELPACGPAALMMQAGLFVDDWEGQPRLIATPPRITDIELRPAPCQRWQKASGDAGWAGVAIDTLLVSRQATVCLIHPPSVPVLSLINESIALAPPARRWDVTFNTYDGADAQIPVRWRCAQAGSATAAAAARSSSLLIDLTQARKPAPRIAAASAARAGQPWRPPEPNSAPPPQRRKQHAPDQPQSTGEIELALDEPLTSESHHGSHQPVPPPVPTKPNRRPRRRTAGPGLAIAFVAVVILLMGTVAAGFWMMRNRTGDTKIVDRPAPNPTDVQPAAATIAPPPPDAAASSDGGENQPQPEEELAKAEAGEKSATADSDQEPADEKASVPEASPVSKEQTSRRDATDDPPEGKNATKANSPEGDDLETRPTNDLPAPEPVEKREPVEKPSEASPGRIFVAYSQDGTFDWDEATTDWEIRPDSVQLIPDHNAEAEIKKNLVEFKTAGMPIFNFTFQPGDSLSNEPLADFTWKENYSKGVFRFVATLESPSGQTAQIRVIPLVEESTANSTAKLPLVDTIKAHKWKIKNKRDTHAQAAKNFDEAVVLSFNSNALEKRLGFKVERMPPPSLSFVDSQVRFTGFPTLQGMVDDRVESLWNKVVALADKATLLDDEDAEWDPQQPGELEKAIDERVKELDERIKELKDEKKKKKKKKELANLQKAKAELKGYQRLKKLDVHQIIANQRAALLAGLEVEMLDAEGLPIVHVRWTQD